ncbi:hypothetical protein GNF80_13270 [Clostridium perfringens]|nr:hypothetical protein [Clostridium perfringens]
MYKGIGVNMDKEYRALRKRTKRFVPPSYYKDNCPSNNYDYCSCNDYDEYNDNINDYSFFNAIEDMKDCVQSNDNSCKIKSCLLDKEIEINKKMLIISCIGAAAGIIGMTCAIKKMNSKPQKRFLTTAPTLMKFAKNML